MEKKKIFRGLQKYPLIVAVMTQVFVLLFLRNYFVITNTSVTFVNFIFCQSLLCVLLCQFVFKLPRWFIVISFLFPVIFSLAWTYLHISAGIYGVIFILLALTFSHTLKERVPLYLSNNTTHESLKHFVINHKAKNFLDIGSGLGGVVRAISSENITSHGVESAPMLWILSGLWSMITRRGVIYRKNIWQTDFSNYDVIYAFLSPAIMEKLFKKVKNEMKAGSVFVSNSFAVPNVKDFEVRTLDDGRKTKLYIYRQ